MNFCESRDSFHHEVSGSGTEGLMYVRISHILNGLLLSSVTACGLIGSIFNFLIFGTLHRLRLRPFLLALTAWDFALLLISWPIFSLSVLLHDDNMPTSGRWAWGYLICYVGCNIAYTGCIWATICLTVERYLAICHPLWHRAMSSAKRIRVAAAMVFAIAVISNVPRYFEYDLDICIDSETGCLLWQLSPTKLLESKFYLTAYLVVGGCLANTIFPFTLLVSMSARIFLTLSQSTKGYDLATEKGGQKSRLTRQRSYGRRQSLSEPIQRHRMTRMLMVILVKFICCHTLPTAIDILQATLSNQFLQSISHRYLVDASIFLVMLHSASNFLVYAGCERQFRLHLTQRLWHSWSTNSSQRRRFTNRWTTAVDTSGESDYRNRWKQQEPGTAKSLDVPRRHSCAAAVVNTGKITKGTITNVKVGNKFRDRKDTL